MIPETKQINGKMHVILSGSIYVNDATELRETFTYLVNKGHLKFVVDLSRVDYIDSTGLGMLVFVHKLVLQRDGNIRIDGLQGIVKELFELTRLTKVFDIH